MILRKPYAFFIKIFKPLHLLMALLTIVLLTLQNKILTFLNNYINSTINVVGMDLRSTLGNNLLIIIPVILIILFIFILGIMVQKKKPSSFYVITIFSLIVVIVINIYTFSFLTTLEETIVSIKIIKLIHDIVMINIIIEIIITITLIIRGIGINIKKFNFSSDISNINISESDREEFELNINIDFDESRRKRKASIRNLKYKYFENKFIYNCIIVFFVLVLLISMFTLISKKLKVNKEGIVYQVNGFSYSVNKSMLINTDFKGNKITNNYLVVIDIKLKAGYKNSLYTKDFTLKVGDFTFKNTNDYNKYLIDLGNVYTEQNLFTEFENYLFVFEIPENYINKEMNFMYSHEGEQYNVKLNPKKLEIKEETNIFKIGDELVLDTLQNIKFKINEYEIRNQYLIEYNYCIKSDDCVLSKEYLKPTINTNFDKYILKLNIDYFEGNNLDMNSFYKLLSTFGEIKYKIEGKWYTQNTYFEEIKSNKSKENNNIYIGINANISNASEIKFVFNIRGKIKEYMLKGEI